MDCEEDAEGLRSYCFNTAIRILCKRKVFSVLDGAVYCLYIAHSLKVELGKRNIAQFDLETSPKENRV